MRNVIPDTLEFGRFLHKKMATLFVENTRPVECVYNTMPVALFHRARLNPGYACVFRLDIHHFFMYILSANPKRPGYNICRHKLSILLVYTIILGIASLTFSSCSTHRAIRLRNKSIKEWSAYQLEEVKKSPEGKGEKWTIYSRKIKGTSFLEYKIEGNIESTPKDCVSAFRRDIHNQANDLKNEKYPTYDIVYESTDSLLIYLIHKEPFPFKNTEMSLRYLFFQSTESNTEEVKWEESWDESSPSISKKFSRVQTFRGSWNFTSITHDTSLAVYSVQFDPKKMPLWLAEPMVNNLLVDGLENMREMTSKLN